MSGKRPTKQSLSSAAVNQRNASQEAIRLLQEWMADESGYDEEVWPVVKKAIEENRPSYRSRFSG